MKDIAVYFRVMEKKLGIVLEHYCHPDNSDTQPKFKRVKLEVKISQYSMTVLDKTSYFSSISAQP